MTRQTLMNPAEASPGNHNLPVIQFSPKFPPGFHPKSPNLSSSLVQALNTTFQPLTPALRAQISPRIPLQIPQSLVISRTSPQHAPPTPHSPMPEPSSASSADKKGVLRGPSRTKVLRSSPRSSASSADKKRCSPRPSLDPLASFGNTGKPE